VSLSIRELGLTDETTLVELMDAVVPGWTDLLVGACGPLAFLADSATFAYGAWLGDEPVGWAYGAAMRLPNGRRITYLHELDVVEHARRRGIATMLIEASMGWARRHGCTRFWLSTGGHNEVAQAVYDSLGGVHKPVGDVNYWWEL
jgi:GNAT superfamily N-acetyltransferase